MPVHRILATLLIGILISTARAAGPIYTEPDKADADFPFQGEYLGKVKTNDGDVTVGLQIIALGKGKFHAVGYHGGLPGDGWDKETKHEADGELTDGVAVFMGNDAIAKVKDGVATITSKDGV